MKAEQSFKEFVAKNGETVILRSIKWEDLDLALEFINNLVSEKLEDPDFGIVSDKQTRESEAKWLADRLIEIESGNAIHVIAFGHGKLIGNCGVSRGKGSDEFHHGTLGISVSKEYRNFGIGREMLKTAIEECRKAGFKTIELEAFGNNQRAIHLYERVGFKQVGVIPKKIHRNGRFYDIVVMSIEL